MSKSWKVLNSNDGNLAMVVITGDDWSLSQLNRLLRNGMNVTAIDERSDLVDKNFVDKADDDD